MRFAFSVSATQLTYGAENGVRSVSVLFELGYCVDGHRVSLTDKGIFGESTEQEREAIKLFELDRYAEYLRWRAEFRQRVGSIGSIIPFESNYVRSI